MAPSFTVLGHFHNRSLSINTLRPRQNGCHFADDISCIFLYENVWLSLKISLKVVPKVRIINISALVQVMAWCRPGEKSLSEPVVVSVLTYICGNRPQWVNGHVFHINTASIDELGTQIPRPFSEMDFCKKEKFYLYIHSFHNIHSSVHWGHTLPKKCFLTTN